MKITLNYIFLFIAFLFLHPINSFAQTPTTPIIIGSSIVDGPTLAIPRWKGYMSQTNPDNFWAGYANGGSGFPSNLRYTTDGGETWSTEDIQVSANGRTDFHLSAAGLNDELYFTWPDDAMNAIGFRKINYPAHSNSDRGPLGSISGTSSANRSNITVQDNGRIWLFTRLGNSSSSNVPTVLAHIVLLGSSRIRPEWK